MRHLHQRSSDPPDVIDAQSRVVSTVNLTALENTLKLTTAAAMALVLAGAAFEFIPGHMAMWCLLAIAVVMVAMRYRDNAGKRPAFTFLALLGIAALGAAMLYGTTALNLLALAATGGVWLVLHKTKH